MKYCLGILTECIAVLFTLATYPSAIIDRNPKTLPFGSQKVTVICHGFLHNRSCDLYLRHKLSAYPEIAGPIFTVNLGHPFQSIDDYTLTLRNLILEIKRKLPVDQQMEINLIGHSMGGLVCTNYAVNYAEEDNVHIAKIITLASPLRGTKTAYIASPFCKAAQEMTPNSKFLQELHSKRLALNPDIFFHIGCGIDLIVNKDNSFFEGENDYVFPFQGHFSPIYSPKVANLIIECLRNPHENP
jgi:pimeloyl-ACP methyl ester carboxylesterase